MRRSKSSDIVSTVYIRAPSQMTDVSSNLILKNLLKNQPSIRNSDPLQSNAYDLAHQQSNSPIKVAQRQRNNQFFKKQAFKNKQSRQQLDKLLKIEDDQKIQAFHTLCSNMPFKSRGLIDIKAKELKKIEMSTLGGRIKAIDIVKKVMGSACDKIKNNKKQQKGQGQYSSSRSILNWSGKQSDSLKSSQREQREQTEQMQQKQRKYSNFQLKLRNSEFDQVYNTQRRKQSWKAYLQVQRNKVIMMKSSNFHNAKIMFVLGTERRKKSDKKSKCITQNQENDQGYGQLLNQFKKYNRNFENLSKNYKLNLR